MQTLELNIQLCQSSVEVGLQKPPIASVYITDEVFIDTQMESFVPLVVVLNSEVIGT